MLAIVLTQNITSDTNDNHHWIPGMSIFVAENSNEYKVVLVSYCIC